MTMWMARAAARERSGMAPLGGLAEQQVDLVVCLGQ
jgi:hypothetical protein